MTPGEEAAIREDERTRVKERLEGESRRLMDEAIAMVTAGDEAQGLPKIMRASAIAFSATLIPGCSAEMIRAHQANEVTLATIRETVARALRLARAYEGPVQNDHARGFTTAMEEVQAILDLHGEDPSKPVQLGGGR